MPHKRDGGRRTGVFALSAGRDALAGLLAYQNGAAGAASPVKQKKGGIRCRPGEVSF